MKGRYWNHNFCIPEQPLIDFLEEKSKTTQDRIKEATGLTINRPIYYSAEYSFNIDKIISHIKSNLARERRIIKINESTKQFIY